MADDCRPQQYTHTATVISSLFSRFVGGLVDLLIRLCFCFGLAVLLLGPSCPHLLFCKGSRL